MTDDPDARLRMAMFAYLDRLSAAHPEGIRSDKINAFVFEGETIRLIVQPGIRKPAHLSAALTIRTTYTAPGADAPYEDEFGEDGTLRYKWRGTDPNHADNRALREAMVRRLPLAYFYAVARGVYQAIYPVFLVNEDPMRHEFAIDVIDAPTGVSVLDVALDRRYAHRLTRHRLHQAVFRPLVLRAYEHRCALCRLGHLPLLDAAHILPDVHEHGDPVVPNGLTMCKIHHAAYDVNIIGIRPDGVVDVRPDVLAEIDGPMLRHGLQEMHGSVMFLPRHRRDQPDPARLEERYEQFLAA